MPALGFEPGCFPVLEVWYLLCVWSDKWYDMMLVSGRQFGFWFFVVVLDAGAGG